MTNQTPESVIAEVIEYHADAIDTHGPGCYKNHAACLAVKPRDMLREPGELAALAAIERVRAIHVRYEHWLCVECSWEYPETSYDALSNDVAWPCPTVAALDGALEPEEKP